MLLATLWRLNQTEHDDDLVLIQDIRYMLHTFEYVYMCVPYIRRFFAHVLFSSPKPHSTGQVSCWMVQEDKVVLMIDHSWTSSRVLSIFKFISHSIFELYFGFSSSIWLYEI